jgi:hypothetical protein
MDGLCGHVQVGRGEQQATDVAGDMTASEEAMGRSVD